MPRTATLRSAQQILAELRDLTRSWTGDHRPQGICDIHLDELCKARPDLKEKP